MAVAFIYWSGCVLLSRWMIASLWSADDTFTHALMDRFYTHIVAGEDQASALRDAKLDLLAKYGRKFHLIIGARSF